MNISFEARKEELIAHFKRPMQESITIEDLIRQKPPKPMNELAIDAIIKKMAITEPIELLLSQLSA
jgi:hypothetical protein